MSLAAGSRFGIYEIIGPLGVGGMGEVYRAHDVRLNRDVAIKVLPPAFAADGDRLSRFEREARTLAALNHPNIAHIYGVLDPPQGDSHGLATAALVMEFVDGEDLAVRMARGPIPLHDALPIAKQIAEALEAAHERGIIHRDLKPANVKVRRDGTIKVLDFGLAKAVVDAASPQGPAADSGDGPTVTSPTGPGQGAPALTQLGTVLGTAAYMAPEQARGGIVDRRVDIWAFGCVLYEMLAGKRAFDGPTVTDVLSAIVSREPDWDALPAATMTIHKLLHRCLDKDPRRRLRDIGEARLMLDEPDDGRPVASPRSRSRAALLAKLVAAVVVVAIVSAVLLWRAPWRSDDPVPAITRFDVQPPDNATLVVVFRTSLAVSADGSTIAFTATSEGINRIYVRSRSEVTPHAIPGSEGGISPELSSDGRWVAFFADGAVLKAPVDGRATRIAPGRDVRGIAWGSDNTLVLTTDPDAPLVRMSDAGGELTPVTALRAGERTHRWPDVLPDGRAALFTVGSVGSPDYYDDSTIEAVILSTGERRVVVKGAAMARYCGNNQLVYSKGPALFAVPFDLERLTTGGRPVQIVAAVARDASTGAAQFDCAVDGTLVYAPGATEGDLHRLVWSDPGGKLEPTSLQPGPYNEVRVSPDGTRVALLSGNSGTGDIWIHEFATGAFTRLTFNTANAAPTWSADGAFVYYTAFDRIGLHSVIMKHAADGTSGPQELRTLAGRARVAWVDASQRTAVVDVVGPTSNRGDVLLVSLQSADEPKGLVATPANEYGSSVSRDGQWLAYQADETGRPEVYVRDFQGLGIRRQVTTAGGEEPHWSADGRVLFYRLANRLMSVPVEQPAVFRVGAPRGLFDGLYNTGVESGRSYDVNQSTGRFLLVQPTDGGQSARVVRVVLNWHQLLREQ